jgi:hypothetical protein
LELSTGGRDWLKEMLIDDSDAVEWDKALSTSWNQWDEELIV